MNASFSVSVGLPFVGVSFTLESSLFESVEYNVHSASMLLYKVSAKVIEIRIGKMRVRIGKL